MALHLWLRAETRPTERRTPLMPEGAAALIAAGARVSVEQSAHRCVPAARYAEAGCAVVPEGSWPDAPADALILGIKELPEGAGPLRHRHAFFAHAFKGQAGAGALLARFAAGGGVLHDLEYLTDAEGRRLVAFGYWAGFAGAAAALMAFAAGRAGGIAGPLAPFAGREAMVGAVRAAMGAERPRVLVIGALGRTGRGAADLCAAAGLEVTRWDMAETASGGPFPEVLAHEVMLNCIVAGPATPVFVPAGAGGQARALRVVGDIACDPGAPWNPIRINDRLTGWAAPARRVHDAPPLDVVAIDNLPSLLPAEASADFAAGLLPLLQGFPDHPAWGRARASFEAALRAA